MSGQSCSRKYQKHSPAVAQSQQSSGGCGLVAVIIVLLAGALVAVAPALASAH